MGPDRRRVLEHEILDGTKTYRQAFNIFFLLRKVSFTKCKFIRDALQEMWDSVHISWDEAWAEYLDSKYILNDTQI
jgi:2-hydroxy-3-keto-5-methylthiopentenyl-1-phosphate phosphatase